MLIWVNAIYLIWFPHSLESSTASLSLLGPGGVSVDRYVLFLYIFFISDTIICLNQYCWGDRALCLPWHQIESTRSQQRGSFTFPLSLTFLFLTNLYSHHSHLLKPLHPLHSPLSVLPSSFSIFLPHQSLTFSSWHSSHSLRPSIRPLVDCPTRWSLWYGYLDFYFDTQMTWEI